MMDVGTQTLETERLLLRRFTVEDAEEMYTNWASDPVVTKYLTWPVHENVDATRSLLANWVESYSDPVNYHWGIQLRQGSLIGSIGVVRFDDEVEMKSLGYCIGQAWWGKGYTSEALAAVIGFLIERVGVNRVEAFHDPANPASGRVMEKCGMRHEGIFRSQMKSNQGITDASCWAILANDYHMSLTLGITVKA